MTIEVNAKNRRATLLSHLTRGAAAMALIALPSAVMAEALVFDHVSLLDGRGGPAQRDMTVAVDGGRFTLVTPTIAARGVAGRHIDATGRYLMPSLIDVHIHLGGPYSKSHEREAGMRALAGYLYSGVTTIYDAGNDPKFILPLRDDERAGRIMSPCILATGNLITYPGSHGDANAIRVDSWPQGKVALDRHMAEQKPDIVKLTYEEHGWGSRPMIPMLPKELMEEIIHYYNAHGLRTTVHTSSELRATEAIYAGADSLAHPVIQGPVSEDFVRLMAAKKVPMATTLTIGEGYSRLVEHPEYLDEPLYAATYSKEEIIALRTKTLPEWKARSWTWWMKLMTPVAEEGIVKIDAAGGIVAIGTDQASGPAVHREMELLQSSGVKPAEIVRIATLNGARHLGMEEKLGSIEVGKIADALLLEADPSIDINNAKKIVMVMKAGEMIDESKLPLAGGPRKRRWSF